jgi:hypothetical protein
MLNQHGIRAVLRKQQKEPIELQITDVAITN